MKRFFVVIVLIFLFASINSQSKGVPDYFVLDGADMFPMVFHLEVGLIYDQTSEIRPAPELISEPYVLRSYVRIDTGEIVEFEMYPANYYPDEGLIYVIGQDGSGAVAPFAGRWYPIHAEFAATIDAYIARGQALESLQKTLPMLWDLVSTSLR